MSFSKRSLCIPTHNSQPSILAHFAKKPKVVEDATSSDAFASSHSTNMLEIEVPFPLNPALCTFPDQFAKSETGHSIQKQWFEDFPWLQLAENKTSIYYGSYWAYKNRRLNVSDMSILKNTKLPWINKDEGFPTFKKVKESIKKHNECRIHRDAESALRSAW